MSIILKNLKTGVNHTFEVTQFPDKTSQVWKINPEPEADDRFQVIWMFEREIEFIYILQLGFLLYDSTLSPQLVVPFLPYARQDKEPGNKTTFAVWPMLGALKGVFDRITTYDVHSDMCDLFDNIEPWDHFFSLLGPNPEDQVVVFPDEGAFKRYGSVFHEDIPTVIGRKVRNQETGEITGLYLEGDVSQIDGSRCIIYDDICDGGMTFIKLAEQLKAFKPKQIDLCVSHGIFSKGKQVIHDAGISGIYATNSLLTNTDGYPVVNLEE